jgi:predicted flap endonuclease-1-like 5' DNA nuclease
MANAIPQPSANQLKAQQYQSAADILAAAGRVADAEKYQSMAEKLNPREEVTGQPFEVTDASGQPLLVQQMKSGKLQTLQGFGPKREVVLQNLGGQTVAVNKSALRGGETFQQTMTPGETASNIIAQGNLAVAQGQLGVARGGLGLRQQEFARGAFDRVETPEGFFNVPKGGGVAQPVMGPSGQLRGAGGTPTEGQSNAAGFAQRMELAESILGRLPAGSQPGAGTRIAEAVPFVGGALARSGQSADTQMYDQAAQDWIRAKLRKESGAAIGADEMKQEYATYFPMVGDTPEKIAQKAEARRVVTLGMGKSAGKAYQPYTPPAPAPMPAAARPARLVRDPQTGIFRYVQE